tara:strand:+ start:599 stop:1318 length:720 start_codon:yes stop_codon:yes gene_type:complete
MRKTFKACLFKLSKKQISDTKIIYYSGVFLLTVPLIIQYIYSRFFNIEIDGFLYTTMFIIGMIAILLAYFYQLNDFEKIKSKKNGFLEFGEDELIISFNERIKYTELTEFQLLIDAYYNEFINHSYRVPEERRSLGISNSLKITHNLKSRTFYFKLEDESHKNILERSLYQLVINDKLKNIDGKKSIKLIPEKFSHSTEYKEHIIKQLKEKKVSCTEGLLMIGYKNYEEAQKLKKKYCG